MRAFIKFNKGMMKMPVHWQLWLLLLVAVNLIIPLFFLDRLEAQVLLGVMLASMVLITILTALGGIARPWASVTFFGSRCSTSFGRG